MKKLFLLLCVFGATAAFGQGVGAGAMSNEASAFEMPSHPKQAVRVPMGDAQNLREESQIVSAQGERPLWEVAPKIKVVPLGDVARQYKLQHETVKKAEIIWEN